MSWLPNPFKSFQFPFDDNADDDVTNPDQNDAVSPPGVKDDLSAIGDSISRQFRGVAAFLAPPSAAATSSATAVAGVRSDLAEISGTLKNTFSILSNPNLAVSEISKLASDFLQLNNRDFVEDDDDSDDDNDDDDEYDDDCGVTDEVIEFSRQISDRPELWIDFPLPLDDFDFDMSEAQSEHASMVEQLVPSLADLRSSISNNKSEHHFWMIYFILLLPRLNDDDLELLSTPQIVQARESLLMMLRTNNEEINSDKSFSNSSSTLNAEQDTSQSLGEVTKIENRNVLSNTESRESNATEKITGAKYDPLDGKTDEPELSRNLSSKASKSHENVDHVRAEAEPVPKTFENEDDVSFSDLEDDDNDLRNRGPSSGLSHIKRNSSTEGSSDWVRLNEGTRESRGQASFRDRDSEGYESTEWLTVDDFDS